VMTMDHIDHLTLALPMNSLNKGEALCSTVSRTRVIGLALSRKLSNFCTNNKLCDRLCDCADGAIFDIWFSLTIPRPQHSTCRT
jgi:hypothetical protein